MPFHLMARELIFGVIRAHKLVPDERIGFQMPPGKPEPRCHVTFNTGLRSAVVFTLCEALASVVVVQSQLVKSAALSESMITVSSVTCFLRIK